MTSTRQRLDSPLKHFLLPFLIAVCIYAIAYQFIEYRRNRKGTWHVTFTNTESGDERVIINQPFLAITNFRITFEGSGNSNAAVSTTLIFDKPREVPYDVPFGKCIFMDTTFLPGTATFQFYGHEIELLPRTLIIDHEEHQWRSDSSLTLKKKDSREASPESN